MKNAPSSGTDRLPSAVEAPAALAPGQIIVKETRGNAREALNAADALSVNRDAVDLARALDAPAVLDNKTLALLTMIASGVALPGCDAGTVCCVIGGVAVPLGIAGVLLIARNIRTKNLKAGEVGVFTRHGLFGNLAQKLGFPRVEIYKGRPVTYLAFDQEYEGGFLDQPVNFPAPKEGKDGQAIGGADYSKVLESEDNVRHTFTWSVIVEVLPDADEKKWPNKQKFYEKFKKGKSDADQSGIIYDITQKALSKVVGKTTFKDVTDANQKHDAISAAVHAAIKDTFAETFGASVTFNLGDIQAPAALAKIAEEKLILAERAKMGANRIQIAEDEGKANLKRAEHDAQALKTREGALTEALGDRVTKLGLNDDKAKSTVVLADAATRTAETLGTKVLGIFADRLTSRDVNKKD